MHVSLNWLKNFVSIPSNLDPKDLARQLTLKTAEVDGVHFEAENLENIVAGQILEIKQHPNADKLKVTKVSTGKETLQIVCGGINLIEGMFVAVAKVGSKVRWHGQGDLITLEKTNLRGVDSEGMICAGSEIGIEDKNEKDRIILDISAMKPKVGASLAGLFQKDDIIFEFDNKALTHRPDLWGHYGIAREIAAITDAKLKPLVPKVKIPEKGEQVKVDVKEPTLCPRYCGLIIENIKVEESPDWIKKLLKATNHGTHNNIVDVTNFVMTELGQPMHAFDKNYIKNGIVVRRAKPNEKITCLDEKTRELSPENLVIADHEKPLAIAGVIGGENSGINDQTTSIILESATFHSTSIRRTSTKFMLRTDAVQRFEKALDPNLAELAIKRAAELILQICPGAKIAGPITDVKNFDENPVKIILDTEKAASKIGVDLSQAEMKKILEKLEFKVTKKSKNTVEVTVPSFRATKDVGIEDDLIEEVVRMYGYDQLPESLPTLPAKLPMENTERFKKHRLRELLSYGLGFSEVFNYSFYGKTEIEKSLLKEDGHIKLLNYLSEDQTHMRTTLVPNILKNLQNNIKYFEEVRLYEIGHTYKEIGQFYPLEEKVATGAILIKEKNFKVFYEAKGVVESIFEKFSTPKLSSAKGIKDAPYAHPNKSLSYVDGHGQTLAKVFMLHPSVAKNHDLENYNIAFFSINFTELMKLPTDPRRYQPLPKFPSIRIDVSILVGRETEVGTLEKAIRHSDQSLITEVKLFDIYEGPNIEAGKKAVAFQITLQSKERTLTDEEMSVTQKKIFQSLEKTGGIIRGK